MWFAFTWILIGGQLGATTRKTRLAPIDPRKWSIGTYCAHHNSQFQQFNKPWRFTGESKARRSKSHDTGTKYFDLISRILNAQIKSTTRPTTSCLSWFILIQTTHQRTTTGRKSCLHCINTRRQCRTWTHALRCLESITMMKSWHYLSHNEQWLGR